MCFHFLSLISVPLPCPTQFPGDLFSGKLLSSRKKKHLFYKPRRCTYFKEHFPQFLKAISFVDIGGNKVEDLESLRLVS